MVGFVRILPVQSVRSESRQISNRSLRQHAANATEEPNLTDAAHRTNGTFSVKVNKSTVAFGIEMMWHSADENLCILTQKSVAKRAR